MKALRRALAAWDSFWFREAPLSDLAIARIYLTALVLWIDQGGRFFRVAWVAPEHWTPVPLLEILGIGQPSGPTLIAMAQATQVALVASMLGVATNASLLVAFALQVVQEGWLNSFGKVTHATLPVLYGLLFLAMSPSGQAWSVDALLRRWWNSRAAKGGAAPAAPATSRWAAWPMELLFVEIAAFYFQAGWSKVHASGFAWADGYSLQYYLLQKYQPAGLWLASQLWLCRALSAGVLALELGFPLAIFAKRLRPLFLAGGLSFHLGTWLFMDISFWGIWAVYPVFLPWRAMLRMLPTPAQGREADAPDLTAS